ncbi:MULTISPECIES: hypothetical protein [Silvimonas]|uniref:hypothetical protein n=1 Tax=Silvimonas TaxID=300264 RepID=UPI0024B3C52F|nr:MULTISPECIES: hypothetical protein [Silvimonas]MDR3427593.1 hypothetical protein [Silvimonas sp.]
MNAEDILEKEVAQLMGAKAQPKRRGPSEEAIANANRTKTQRRRQLEDIIETRRSTDTSDF